MLDTKSNPNILIVYFIALGAFSLGMASYITAGLIPLIQNEFDISIALTAQLVTVFTLAYGIGSPVVVALSPENKQRSILLLALFIFSISNLISGLAPNFSILLISRIFAGIGAGVYLAIGISISTALVQPDQRGQAISIIMSGMAAGTVLGVPLGLIISNQFGWQTSMYLIAILGLVSFYGLYIKLPIIPNLITQSLSEKLRLLKDINVLKILFISLIAAISSLGLYTYLFPLLSSDEFGSIENITPFLWIWGIGGVIGSFVVGHISKKIRNEKLTAIIMFMLSVALLLIPFFAAITPWLTLIPIAIWGAVGWALQVPQNEQLILVREKTGGGNLAVALNESALYLGGAIGAGIGGIFFYFQVSLWLLPIFASAVVFIGFIYQVTHINRSK
ncbi:MFS transporter [Acinetobacter guillouiae]|uniref:MFS transporter n=1 Tax=Acinetobacter guillouiae TaxID=106649 RepID=A0A8X8KCA0_ACIGI|nr:MFS transporter [Acinetobacter guillouiae]MCF0263649.1 MFS transporter [Acinetobacter guillouiae]